MSRLVIAGQGAIGSIMAAHCEVQHIPYAVIPRQGMPQEIHYLHQSSGQRLDFTPPAAAGLKQQDILVLPLKAYQVLNCLQSLDMDKTVTIVLLHNGMGTVEPVRQGYPDNPLLAGITSYAAFQQADGLIKETGQGSTQLGWIANPQSSIQTTIQRQFEQLLGPCQWQPKIEVALWHKLAINAAINPLTAIHQIPNGALQRAEFLPTINAICHEVAAVMNKLGITQSPANLLEQVRNVVVATANNYSSMNRDINQSRPTEIDYINGYIIRQAEKLGINVPVIKQLMSQLLMTQNNR